MSEATPSVTQEAREHTMRVIGEVFDMSARRIDAGRSSMPIYVDDALLLAGLALHALSVIPTAIAEPGDPA